MLSSCGELPRGGQHSAQCPQLCDPGALPSCPCGHLAAADSGEERRGCPGRHNALLPTTAWPAQSAVCPPSPPLTPQDNSFVEHLLLTCFIFLFFFVGFVVKKPPHIFALAKSPM